MTDQSDSLQPQPCPLPLRHYVAVVQCESPLVDAGWLIGHTEDPELVILDCRWTLERGAGAEEFRQGHVPGAQFVDLDSELADPPGPRGRHPLPDPVRFAAAMRSKGVCGRGVVLVYDDVTGSAARAWWMLRSAGHPRVLVLDGGLRAYTGAGGRLTAETSAPVPGDFQSSQFTGWLDADQVASSETRGAVLVDARARDRYMGAPNPLDPRPGHLPGARSLPWTELFQDGELRPLEEVRRLLGGAGLGSGVGVVYCGSGVTSCAVLLALEACGLPAGMLYPGSYSEWAANADREVALPA